MTRRSINIILLAACFLGVVATYTYGRSVWVPIYQSFAGKKTVAGVVSHYAVSARERLRPYFESAGISYPPKGISLLGIKSSSNLELWAETEAGPRFIRTYPIQALSGNAGPKLREGDRQVPEGLYEIEGLNPNSSYHLSMKLNYPNSFDLKQAKAEGRSKPGTNIFIHGKAVSIGCLAMGDAAIEELFILAVDIGKDNVQVAITPNDPRLEVLSTSVEINWVSLLYEQLNMHFMKYKRSES